MAINGKSGNSVCHFTFRPKISFYSSVSDNPIKSPYYCLVVLV